MADAEPVVAAAEEPVEAAMFSTLDLIVLGALGLAAVYYLVLRNRKKDDDFSQMQTFTISWVLTAGSITSHMWLKIPGSACGQVHVSA